MVKRFFPLFTLFLLITASALIANAGESEVSLGELARCRKLFGYSGNTSAYFYGFYGRTLYSARVLPDICVKYTNTDGDIIAVSHNDDSACALCINRRTSQYSATYMNMNTGVCQRIDIPKNYTVQPTSFAAVSEGVYIITVEQGIAYAVEIRRDGARNYRMSSDVKELFVNSNNAYALTVSGNIYKLGNGKALSCGNFSGYSNLKNAGCGWLYSAEGALLSLTGGAEYPSTRLAGKSNGTQFTSDTGRLLVCHGSKMAVLRDDYICSFSENRSPEQSEAVSRGSKAASQEAFRSGETQVIAAGMTVAKLREAHPEVLAITDGLNNSVSAGKLKTGYKARLTDGECTLAVLGDNDGSGTVSGLDVKNLMKHFIGDMLFSPAQEKASDFNRDGFVDNRDLVLLAQQHE